MHAMILAAGRGERMRPLTDETPKPLLEAGGKPLIVHQIERLRGAGFRELVVNLGWLGERIAQALGAGGDLGVSIRYSFEPPGALETAGGIRHALPLLGDAPFLVVNSDVVCDYPLERLRVLKPGGLAHLVLVPNPAHHAEGDFALIDSRLALTGRVRYTYAGIGVFSPAMFEPLAPGVRPLRPVLEQAIAAGGVTGEVHCGEWMDIGTPERLEALRARLDAE